MAGGTGLNKTNDSYRPPLVKHSASSFIIYPPKNKLIKKERKENIQGGNLILGTQHQSHGYTLVNKQIPLKEACVQRSLRSYRLHENTDQFGANTSSAPKLQRCYSLRRRIGFLFLFKLGIKRTGVIRIQCRLSTAASAAPPSLLRSSFPK